MYLLDKINILDKSFTDEGYLIVKNAHIARSGIQDYYAIELGLTDRAPDEVVKLYRPELEVFNKLSMDSFSNKPVTNNHPSELVNTKNIKEVSVGHSGDTISKDGIFLLADLTITDADAIKDIESGKKELSNGYTSKIDFEKGVTDSGESYDAIQRDIKGNHIAIVKKGRCGKECKISDKLNEGKKVMTILIDGIDYEAPAQTAQAVNKVLADMEKTEKEKEDAEEELEKEKMKKDKMSKDHKSEVDTLQAKLDDAEKNKVTPEILDALVVKRSGVVEVANKVIANFDGAGKDCETIRKEVVASTDKDLNLEDKSEDYILARFDAVASNFKTGASQTLVKALKENAINDGKEEVIIDARADFMKKSQNAWRMGSAK